MLQILSLLSLIVLQAVGQSLAVGATLSAPVIVIIVPLVILYVLTPVLCMVGWTASGNGPSPGWETFAETFKWSFLAGLVSAVAIAVVGSFFPLTGLTAVSGATIVAFVLGTALTGALINGLTLIVLEKIVMKG